MRSWCAKRRSCSSRQNSLRLVHEERLELSRYYPPEPKSGASANSATRAFLRATTSPGAILRIRQLARGRRQAATPTHRIPDASCHGARCKRFSPARLLRQNSAPPTVCTPRAVRHKRVKVSVLPNDGVLTFFGRLPVGEPFQRFRLDLPAALASGSSWSCRE